MFIELDQLSVEKRNLLLCIVFLGVLIYFGCYAFGFWRGAGYWELLLPGSYALSLAFVIPNFRPSALQLWTAPEQGFLYWAKITTIIACILSAVIALFIGLYGFALGHPIFPDMAYQFGSAQFIFWLKYACIRAPIIEELIFRWMLCPIFLTKWGKWPTIFCSGALFASVHVAYGNPSIDNFLAGYFLAWAFVKSKSIWVPIVLHALGNLCVGLIFLGLTFFN